MSNNVRLVFTSCAAALLLGRAAIGCGSPSSSSSSSGAGGGTSSSSATSASTSSSSASSSSGGMCDHCSTVETMGGSAANLCPQSKMAYDALETCKCGALCMNDCAAECKGAKLGAVCIACLDTPMTCHNQLATCSADQ